MYRIDLLSNDYYNILGVSLNATNKDIKKEYNKLVLKWHPDKNKFNKELSTIYFKKINKAYTELSTNRELYNNTIYKDILSTKTIRKRCCQLGLKITGSKEDLIQRLNDYQLDLNY
jgi:curved DNA-binding protein CbpA